MSAESQVPITAELYREISEFLYREAALLDHRKYKEWLELLADDLLYRMPMRETVEGIGIDNLSVDSSFFEESKNSLRTRVNRLYTKSAWVENPATRQRHFVSNIMIEPGQRLDEYAVRSYFLFKRSRGSLPETEEIFGERNDIVRKSDGEWKLASRTICPDQSVITTMNMSMFL